MESLETLLDGSYWSMFKPRRTRARVNVVSETRPRQTPPTLVVEEQRSLREKENKAKEKRHEGAKKPFVEEEEYEVNSLLDGRYWHPTSNSRRALRNKKRARSDAYSEDTKKSKKKKEAVVDVDDEDEDREDYGRDDEEEEQEVEVDDQEQEEHLIDYEKDDLASLRAGLSASPCSFWADMFGDNTVSDVTCWSRFMRVHLADDNSVVCADWASFLLLLRHSSRQPHCSQIELMRRVLRLADKWKQVPFAIVQ
jgi:hypothetical protein